jgi:hypothetical protein
MSKKTLLQFAKGEKVEPKYFCRYTVIKQAILLSSIVIETKQY